MRKLVVGTVVFWLVGASWIRAADAPAPGPLPIAPNGAAAGTATMPPPADDVNTLPWNPDIRHAHMYPYDKPIQIPTDYVGPPGEFWLGADYLWWGIRGDKVPALVTTGPTASAGVLGQSGVTTLFGGSTVDKDSFNGARFTGGVWFDSSYTLGFEGSYFFLADKSADFSASSSGDPLLARPFVNAFNGLPALSLIASPGLASGSIIARDSNELQGAEANLVWNVFRGPAWSLEMLGGFRYLDLGGDLTIADTTLGLGGSSLPGLSTTTADDFNVRNHFYGGQLGARLQYHWRFLVFDLTEKLALGGRVADMGISGTTVQTSASGFVTATNTGLLAQPSNSGQFTDSAFAVVNELGIQAGWQVCDYVKVSVGYTFLYDSSVVRPGSLVDTTVNTGGGAPFRPAFMFHSTDFWAQGINVGVQVRY